MSGHVRSPNSVDVRQGRRDNSHLLNSTMRRSGLGGCVLCVEYVCHSVSDRSAGRHVGVANGLVSVVIGVEYGGSSRVLASHDGGGGRGVRKGG